MKNIQIQLPEPLFWRLCSIAQMQGVSLVELIRRGMECYAVTCPEVMAAGPAWTMPVLRGSGGHLVDPASVNVEAVATETRFLLSQRMTRSDTNRGAGQC